MPLLQKLTGIDFLKSSFDVCLVEKRDWYVGVHRYSDKNEVVCRKVHGQAISCFTSQEEGSFHVTVCAGSSTSISYLTSKARADQSFIKDCGVHYCVFFFQQDSSINRVLIRTIEKYLLEEMTEFYALMLPFQREGTEFANQFTLIYHDWDAIHCQRGYFKKASPNPDDSIFSEKYLEYLTTVFA